MAVEFELNGQKFVALNGGPQVMFNEAISFQVFCADHAAGRQSTEPGSLPDSRADWSELTLGELVL